MKHFYEDKNFYVQSTNHSLFIRDYGGANVAFENVPISPKLRKLVVLKCWGTGSLVLTETVKSEGWSVPSLFPQSETHSHPLWSLSLSITTVKNVVLFQKYNLSDVYCVAQIYLFNTTLNKGVAERTTCGVTRT
uniref:AlNc14C417G11492 protein n=1 Tax=Albugo laibachii Nc14 TaxID=890382 RepID=F0WZ86_9STRA|nr:AlNc14C417G11492 [Albugo laibachii Nc14]|eukprot:CCA26803.1 AlNc14C417G11492 [Albugo laibachii Nc14]